MKRLTSTEMSAVARASSVVVRQAGTKGWDSSGRVELEGWRNAQTGDGMYENQVESSCSTSCHPATSFLSEGRGVVGRRVGRTRRNTASVCLVCTSILLSRHDRSLRAVEFESESNRDYTATTVGRRMLEAGEGRRSVRYGRYGQKTAEASGRAGGRQRQPGGYPKANQTSDVHASGACVLRGLPPLELNACLRSSARTCSSSLVLLDV